VADIFIACVDGLKGIPSAIETVFPQAQVQLCIVHLVRHSLNYVGWKQRKEVAADLQQIYRAATREEAEMKHLEPFSAPFSTLWAICTFSDAARLRARASPDEIVMTEHGTDAAGVGQ
jgi:transposase-like protein